MTDQSSCKRGFFGKYLRYRIGTLKGNLLICTVLNLLGLPFYAIGHLHISSAQLNGTAADYNFFLYSSFCGSLCVCAVILSAVVGAALSFSYFNKKELTDTLGVLPLTHRERFWGDFLGGYIANVAPFIPSALIAVIMFVVVHKNYSVIAIRAGEQAEDHIGFIIGLSLTLFFVYTFGYIISVLVTAIFGRLIFAEIFSVIGVIVSTVLITGISQTFLNEMTGFPVEHRNTIYAMPLGPLFGEVGEVGECLSETGAFSGIIYDRMEFAADFMILKPLNIAIFTVSAALLTMLAYYIAKSRKQERVGKIVTHGGAFRGIQLVTAAAVIMITVSLNGGNDIILAFYIGVAISAIVAAVFEVIRRPHFREITETVLGYMATAACCFGLCMLFRGTGAFGLRYIDAAPDRVEYINVSASAYYNGANHSGSYTITDKNDIRQFTEKHNSTLKSFGNLLERGSEYVTEYKLADGTILHREYKRRNAGRTTPIPDMLNNIYSLDGYPKMLCGFMSDGSAIESCSATLNGAYGNITVPSDKSEEFLGILTSEIVGKYSPNADNCGSAAVGVADENGGRWVYLPIQNDYAQTIEYLKALDAVNEDNGDVTALTVKLEYGEDLILNVCIYKKDLEDELVKKLFSLLEQGGDSGNPAGTVFPKISITSTNSINYYVPPEAEESAAKIILELAKRAA